MSAGSIGVPCSTSPETCAAASEVAAEQERSAVEESTLSYLAKARANAKLSRPYGDL
jgi:hypothetical protein